MISRVLTVVVILFVGVILGAKYPALNPLAKIGL